MQKVITGQVGVLESRQNGWVAVAILAPGKEYPVKLSTKKQEVWQAAQSMQGQMVDALYNEVQGDTINPHTGQPYVNRYLEAVSPAGTMPQPQQFGNLQPQQQMPPQPIQPQPMLPQPQMQQPMPQPQPVQTMRHEVVDSEQRENRIMRQAATKVASSFLPMLEPEAQNLRSLFEISEQLMRYYREGISYAPDQAEQAQAEYENTPPPHDDTTAPY